MQVDIISSPKLPNRRLIQVSTRRHQQLQANTKNGLMHFSRTRNTFLPDDLAQEGGFSSGVPKMLDAILFLRTGCSFGSSKPREKLDPPPGGRSTLQKDSTLQPWVFIICITEQHSNM